MSSQKQCHRIKKNEDIKAQLIKQNSALVMQNTRLATENKRLATALEHCRNKPPIWRIFKYIKWKRGL